MVSRVFRRNRDVANPAIAIPATWMRTPKSGARRTYGIACTIVGVTAGGRFVIEYERHRRDVRQAVDVRHVIPAE